jgi:translation initiation factor 1
MAKETCTTCGLPDDLCLCEDEDKEPDQINVKVVQEVVSGYQKTTITGFDSVSKSDVGTLETYLKNEFGVGGSIDDVSDESGFGSFQIQLNGHQDKERLARTLAEFDFDDGREIHVENV